MRCSPIFEIRDSQDQGGSTSRLPRPYPGDPGMPNSESPGPPYQFGRATVDMAGPQQTSDGFNYLDPTNPSSINSTMYPPYRPGGGTTVSLSPASNENMDTTPDHHDHPTPNTDISRNNSTTHSSHTSFTPPDHNDSSKNGGNFNLFSTSTGADATIAVPLGASTSTTVTDPSFFQQSTEGIDFPGFTNGANFDISGGGGLTSDDFAIPAGWDISMGSGTGLTPIAQPDGMNWNNTFDGWEGMGPAHQTDVFGRRM